MPNIRANDASSITTAIAVASAYWYCSSLVMIISGAISDTMGMLPAMKMTEPYSPTAREKPSATPVSSVGQIEGSTTQTKVWKLEAPRVSAARSTSRSRSTSTGCSVRTTNGRLTNASATTIPSGV
jgi:hypothetical protein